MSAPVLKVIVQHEVVREIPVQGELTVGRKSDNTLVLEDPSVSGHHGRIHRVAGRWTYSDVGSSNGSFVAAGPHLGPGQDFALRDVTQILLGDTVLEFDPGEGSAPALAGGATARAAHDGPVTAELSAGDPSQAGRPRTHEHTPGPQTTDTLHGLDDLPPTVDEAWGGTTHEEVTPPSRIGNPAARNDQTHTEKTTKPQRAAPAPVAEFDPTESGPQVLPPQSVRLGTVDGAPPAGTRGQGARLLLVIGEQTRTIPINRPVTVMGRSAKCDVVIDHGSVSARHAQIRRDGERFLVEDLGSTNGTRLGLVRLTGPQELSPNTHLILGGADLLFLHDGPGGQRPLEPAAFLRWLKNRRKLTRQEMRKTLDDHEATGKSVEELLVADGVLKPGELTELRHNAAAGLARGDGGRRSTALWLWAAAVVVAAALTALLLL